MEKNFFHMTHDEQYDNLIARLEALGVSTPGVATDMYDVFVSSWDHLKYKHRALICITHELVSMMERSEQEDKQND